jgi:hypothetical protein
MHDQGVSIPTLFVGSEEFQKNVRLNQATEEVQAKTPKREVHVLEHTNHGSFIDTTFWLPKWFHRAVGPPRDQQEVYGHFIGLTIAFVKKHAP